MKTYEEIIVWLKKEIAVELKTTPDKISEDELISSFDLDSILIVTLAVDLEKFLGISLDPTIFYEFKTVRELTDWIIRKHSEKL